MKNEEINCFGTYEKGHEECLICDEAEECENVVKLSNQKEPALSAVLSFLFTGLGQVYNGQFKKGCLLLFLLGLFYALIPIMTIIPILILVIYTIYDAYSTAKKMNAEDIPLQKVRIRNYVFYFILIIPILFVANIIALIVFSELLFT